MNKPILNLPQGVSFDVTEDADSICPNCCGQGLSIFYTVDQIPVHSCLLMADPKTAVNYPCGDLRLGFCQRCGFVGNTLYDASVQEYSTSYEETQGFSETFNAFARRLAQQVIDKYDIHGQTILEIGCGKGEFLALMCELGDNKGIGVDPAYVPERNPDKSLSQVEFIQDFYSEKYSHLSADVICCRHTLEHIGPTWEFMKTLRSTIGDRTDTLVFFELPDVMRVLKEGAFWDIYYEHCTYFTAGSLARLFRATGFEVDDLYLDFDDQYLIITAYPTATATEPKLELEKDMAEVVNAFEAFKETCSKRINTWHDMISEIHDRGEKIVIWGSGSKGVSFLTTLKSGDSIEYVVDINPYKQGKFMPGTGQEIVAPEFLSQYQPQHVIVMNPIYCDEIQRDLDRLGVQAKLWPV